MTMVFFLDISLTELSIDTIQFCSFVNVTQIMGQFIPENPMSDRVWIFLIQQTIPVMTYDKTNDRLPCRFRTPGIAEWLLSIAECRKKYFC